MVHVWLRPVYIEGHLLSKKELLFLLYLSFHSMDCTEISHGTLQSHALQ